MIKKTLKKQNEISGFWQEVADYLEKIPCGIEIARKVAAHNRIDQLLDFNQFNIRDSIYYLNRCRTLYNARGLYIPTGKINTVLHFFKASQSRYEMRKNWDKFVHRPVKDYEISGDHYSLFKMPAVVNLVKTVEEIFSTHY
jgi:surfactin family lipopeptide synthetase A/fengycin family lipopeptide synthetase D